MADVYRLALSLDPVLRHPARFSIITLIIVSGPATESKIARTLGIDWGPLTTHLRRLKEAGYVEARRFPTIRGPRTCIIVTERREKAYYDYLSALDSIVKQAWLERALRQGNSQKLRYEDWLA